MPDLSYTLFITRLYRHRILYMIISASRLLVLTINIGRCFPRDVTGWLLINLHDAVGDDVAVPTV